MNKVPCATVNMLIDLILVWSNFKKLPDLPPVAHWSVTIAHWCGTIAPWCGTRAHWCGTIAHWCGTIALWCGSIAPWCGTIALWCGTIAHWCGTIAMKLNMKLKKQCLQSVILSEGNVE